MFNITDIEENKFLHELTLINQMFTGMGKWDLTAVNAKFTTDFSQQVQGLPFQYFMHVDGAHGKTTLWLDSEKPPIPLGGEGLIQQTDHIWTNYYALTSLKVHGSITVGSFSEPVEGIGWIDRQWYEYENYEADGYEWHAVQLDNGVDLEYYHVFDWCETGTCVVQFPLMDIVPAGMSSWDEAINLTHEFTITHNEYWDSPHTGIRYIKDFTVSHDDGPGGYPDFELHGRLLVDDQESPSPLMALGLGTLGSLFEGACAIDGFYEGEYVEGRSYLEQAINWGLKNWAFPIHVCSPGDPHPHCY